MEYNYLTVEDAINQIIENNYDISDDTIVEGFDQRNLKLIKEDYLNEIKYYDYDGVIISEYKDSDFNLQYTVCDYKFNEIGLLGYDVDPFRIGYPGKTNLQSWIDF